MLILVKTLKISIWVKFYNNLEFGQNVWKISILFKIVGNFDFGQNLPKYRFWTKW